MVYFPLDVQMIHYNAKYQSMDEAKTKEDGIAILTTMFQVQACFEWFQMTIMLYLTFKPLTNDNMK